tara:strand:+ start:1121 stop:1351 length:231 start_codon:yes stop_codon:yes gene_type:complete
MSNEVKNLEDNIKAREIVQSVLDYGVNNNQILQIIYLFALELENPTHVKTITQIINDFKSNKNVASQKKSSIILGE